MQKVKGERGGSNFSRTTGIITKSLGLAPFRPPTHPACPVLVLVPSTSTSTSTGSNT